MSSGDTILFAVVAVVLALALVPLGRGALRAWRLLRGLARWRAAARAVCTASFAEQKNGLAALRGRIEPIDTVRSSWSDREGVYLAYVSSHWENVPTMAGVTAGQWVADERDEVAAPFELSDGQTTVLIEPERAAVFVDTATFERQAPTRARCVEQLLERGQEVVVIGEVAQVGGIAASGTYRGHGFRTVLRAPRHGQILIATAEQLGSALRGRRASAWLRLLPFTIVAGAAVLAAGNALPRVDVQLPGQAVARPAKILGRPFLRERWRRAREAEVVGEGSLRVTTLGWGIAASARFFERVRHELSRRGFFGIIGEPRRTRWLGVFDVLEVKGSVLRRR